MTARRTWLLTGGGGFIGSATTRFIADSFPEVSVVVGGRTGNAGCVLDLSASHLVLPSGIDTVLHLAGEKRDEEKMWAINAEGTKKLVHAAAEAGVRRFVYLSSVGVYGAAKNSGVIDETCLHHPSNVYEKSKNQGECFVRELCPSLGLEYVILQPSNVIGYVQGRAYPLLGLMSALKAGRFLYFGKQDVAVNYVHVEDVAAAITSAAMFGVNSTTYIINTPAKLKELIFWISDELRLDKNIRCIPVWIGRFAAGVGSAIEKITGRAMPFNQERFKELTNNTQYDAEAILELMPKYPFGIETAVRFLVRTYCSEGLL